MLNFNNGDINFNKSYLHSSKVGKLNLNYGKIYKENNQLLFKGDLNFNINNQEQFFKTFQIPKSSRLKVENIYFDLEFNLFEKEFNITSFKLNDSNLEENNFVLELLDNYNNNNEIKNWIDLKNFVNKLFLIYYD